MTVVGHQLISPQSIPIENKTMKGLSESSTVHVYYSETCQDLTLNKTDSSVN